MPCLNLLPDYNNLLLDYNNLLLDYNNLLPDYNKPIIIYYYYNPRININPSCPVGSGTGEMDMEIMKIIKEELQKSEQGQHMKLFNRAIEPNQYSCGLYKAAIENMASPLNDHLTDFEICQQTFEEYKESREDKELVTFDMVHFMHSIYYVDIEQTLNHCFEKELGDKGTVVCLFSGQDLIYWVTLKQNNQWHGKDKNSENYQTAEKIIKNGWKYEIYSHEFPIDVTEVFDEKSTEGNLLLDFLTSLRIQPPLIRSRERRLYSQATS